jgi:hypothetical protein
MGSPTDWKTGSLDNDALIAKPGRAVGGSFLFIIFHYEFQIDCKRPWLSELEIMVKWRKNRTQACSTPQLHPENLF